MMPTRRAPSPTPICAAPSRASTTISAAAPISCSPAALAPDKPMLEDFVSGVPVNEANPVDSCEITVAMTFQGVQAGPHIAPIPRPTLAGDPPNPVY